MIIIIPVGAGGGGQWIQMTGALEFVHKGRNFIVIAMFYCFFSSS